MAFKLDRRFVLRGLAATGATVVVPLPRLGGMLNGNGTAYADGTALPRRFGTWIFGDGVGQDSSAWVPGATGTGDAWKLSRLLAPLGPVKSHLNVVTGMKWDANEQKGSSHHHGATNALCGTSLLAEEGSPGLPSIDQVIAKAPEYQGAPIHSLQVGLCTGIGSAVLQNSCLCYTSWTGPNAPNPADYNPRGIFNRLFGAGVDINPQSAAAAKKLVAVRKSVLDVVMADGKRLLARLGASDKARVDQHLEGIRQLEHELGALADPSSSACPANAADYPERTDKIRTVWEDVTTREAPPELDDIMGNLIVLALACDRTRIFTYEFTLPSATVLYRNLGFTDDFHNAYTHAPDRQADVEKGVLYAIGQLSRFLVKMKSSTDGAGTSLLDSSCIYTTSDLGNGQSHGQGNHPVIVSGKGNGVFRGDVHVSESGENVSKILFTLASAMGAPVTSYGMDPCRVTSGVSGILA